VGRRHEGRHRLNRFAGLIRIGIEEGWFPASRFDADGPAGRQGEQFAARRQFDQVIRLWGADPAGSVAGHGQARVIEDFSRAGGKDKGRNGCGAGTRHGGA